MFACEKKENPHCLPTWLGLLHRLFFALHNLINLPYATHTWIKHHFLIIFFSYLNQTWVIVWRGLQAALEELVYFLMHQWGGPTHHSHGYLCILFGVFFGSFFPLCPDVLSCSWTDSVLRPRWGGGSIKEESIAFSNFSLQQLLHSRHFFPVSPLSLCERRQQQQQQQKQPPQLWSDEEEQYMKTFVQKNGDSVSLEIKTGVGHNTPILAPVMTLSLNSYH